MILFLDFDGVLHPQYEGQAVPHDVAFCHMPRFEAVMRDFPKVNIVISSTWRIQFDLVNLRGRFSEDIASRIIGATPVLDANGPPLVEKREAEILAWLFANGHQNRPWIALDDAFWEFKHHRNRVVVCKSFIGLDESVACKLRATLGSASFASSSREPRLRRNLSHLSASMKFSNFYESHHAVTQKPRALESGRGRHGNIG